jgi:hypothetical protein
MKKLLFALPIVLLVAAGCNKASQPASQQSTKPATQTQSSNSTSVDNSNKPTGGKKFVYPDLGLSMLIPNDWDYKTQKIIYGYDAKANRVKLPLPEYSIDFLWKDKNVAYGDAGLRVSSDDNDRYVDSVKIISSKDTFAQLSAARLQETIFNGEYHYKKISTIQIAQNEAVEYQDDKNSQMIKIWFRKGNVNYIFWIDDPVTYYTIFQPYLTTIEFTK